MKKFFILFLLFFFFAVVLIKPVSAQDTPDPCFGSWCPLITGVNYSCATDYNAWLQNKSQNLWVSDPEVTALGKAGERSRQFLYWTLTHRSIDDHPVLLSIWSFVKNIVYFLLLIIAAIFGLGIIIGQRANFNLKIEVWPLVLKLIMLFLYVAFSASIILLVIQLSDTLMLFFIERLGVKNLFNIFFLQAQGGSVISDSETAYQTFKGCSNLNVDLLDSVKTSKFMVHFTNMTYYILGIMLILRKVILWLLLFVSPFLAILMPFVFIRNAGWIWIGVFFQWVFYGPLFGLFLGGLASIWNSPSHIPYNFDFSRTNKMEGFIYQTTINILYGGPAQKLDILNSSNYADTFAEYIIALIMLWAVTFFPWWLLRIFRDYCCEGIYASKNILLSIYDQMRGGPPPAAPGPVPAPTPAGLVTGVALKIPKEEEMRVRVKLETVEEIKKTRTEDIARSLSFSVSHLTDVARFETDKKTQETVSKNLNFLQNPMKAETPTERQKYMNIRSELFNRAIKEDKTAKQVLSSLSTSRVEQVQKREEFIKSISQPVAVTHVVSVKVKIPKDKIQSITTSLFNTVSSNNQAVTNIAQNTNLQTSQVKSVLNSIAQNIDQPANVIAEKVSQKTGVEKEKVVKVMKVFSETVKKDKEVVRSIAQQQNIKSEQIDRIVKDQIPVMLEPEKHIEESISIPPSISLDEYEQVKGMWRDQYERGEVPVSDRIKSREDWVGQDVIFITNVLNKLVSQKPELRQEGLDELGYILPIFLINNLKGDQLMVYLKAKLEAAKEVETLEEKEKEAKAEVEEKKEEELVEVEKPKIEEKEKVMEMKQELEEKKEEEKPTDAKPAETKPTEETKVNEVGKKE